MKSVDKFMSKFINRIISNVQIGSSKNNVYIKFKGIPDLLLLGYDSMNDDTYHHVLCSKLIDNLQLLIGDILLNIELKSIVVNEETIKQCNLPSIVVRDKIWYYYKISTNNRVVNLSWFVFEEGKIISIKLTNDFMSILPLLHLNRQAMSRINKIKKLKTGKWL